MLRSPKTFQVIAQLGKGENLTSTNCEAHLVFWDKVNQRIEWILQCGDYIESSELQSMPPCDEHREGSYFTQHHEVPLTARTAPFQLNLPGCILMI